MGVAIDLRISYSVTQSEWKKIYEEVLQLADAFPLAELRRVTIRGNDIYCLTKAVEHGMEHRKWKTSDERVGLYVDGDYTYLRTGEDYYLPRHLGKGGDTTTEPECGDAIFNLVPAYLNYRWDDKRFDVAHSLWGAKTQGSPYHMYLLAIGCLIASRLGNRAFVSGDITRGQCLKAVEMANEELNEPIHIPDQCVPEKLVERVQALPLTEKERIVLFESLYLGNKDAEFGQAFREGFSPEALEEYWKDRFGRYRVNQIGFDSIFSEYLTWGFDLGTLCDYVNFESTNGAPLYEGFINHVMDAKLHVREKDCTDVLAIAQDDPRPYGVATQFTTMLGPLYRLFTHHRKVNRYIPINEIREALRKELGDKLDTDALIDAYLEREALQKEIHITKDSTEQEVKQALEQDASEVWRQIYDLKEKEYLETREGYDITETDGLMFYKEGDSIRPGLLNGVMDWFRFYKELAAEEVCLGLMTKTADVCFRFLVSENQDHGLRLTLRDKDWQKIHADIKEHPESFARYYPMVRVKIVDDEIENIVQALVINDDFYDLCMRRVAEAEDP